MQVNIRVFSKGGGGGRGVFTAGAFIRINMVVCSNDSACSILYKHDLFPFIHK